tara:strand:+ start:6991 stop:7620 length:630 start_codon:yes stop_codon:yes gene_type:complete
MVSFIPCYKKSSPIAQVMQLTAVILLAILLLISPTAQAEGIKLKFVELDAVDDGYQFNANLEIVLSPTLKKALKKGIALYFVTDFRLVSPRWYWFDKRIARSKQRDSLSYYALTRQYRLSGGLQNQSFSTLKEALRVLGRVRDRPIETYSKLLPDKIHIAKLRTRLDLSRMRKPFQIEALASKEWNLSSGWHQWKLKFPLQRLILQDKQ